MTGHYQFIISSAKSLSFIQLLKFHFWRSFLSTCNLCTSCYIWFAPYCFISFQSWMLCHVSLSSWDSLSHCGWEIIAVLSFIVFHWFQLRCLWGCVPPDSLKDLVLVCYNLSSCNLPSMVAEFMELVRGVHLPWVAVEQTSIEFNLQACTWIFWKVWWIHHWTI